MLLTKQNIIDAATKKGLIIHFQTFASFEKIGIQTKNSNFHWFTIWDELFVTFCHTYSQNNGTTKKGFKHECKVLESLNLL